MIHAASVTRQGDGWAATIRIATPEVGAVTVRIGAAAPEPLAAIVGALATSEVTLASVRAAPPRIMRLGEPGTTPFAEPF